TNVVLHPPECAVGVANLAAFQSRYGTTNLVLGTYTGNLNNAGDRVVLRGSVLEPVLDFTYSDEWYPVTDGAGFSLSIVNANAARTTWDLAASWRAGSVVNGTPGWDDPAVPS